METASTFRERAGVFAALLIICSYIAMGPIEAVGSAVWGSPIRFSEGWAAAMNALASAAVGFLIGKQTTNAPAVSVPVTDAAKVTATVQPADPAGPGD